MVSRKTTRRRRGARRITIKRRGDLTKYGQRFARGTPARHMALGKATKRQGQAPVVRKLNALAVLQKNTHPDNAAKARADMAWLKGRR